ncbi:MAG: hypothetical protein ABSF56_03455 [Minisyncoccia bacterium]|jgi:hypothetical protein
MDEDISIVSGDDLPDQKGLIHKLCEIDKICYGDIDLLKRNFDPEVISRDVHGHPVIRIRADSGKLPLFKA